MSAKIEVTEEVEAALDKEDIDPDESAAGDSIDESNLFFDTSEDYAEVFGSSQPEFDSWDEFSTQLEEFSRRTGFYYKPRSACTVEYLNEKRVHSPIPDRFVYAKVKMICVHFGDPRRSENGHAPRKDFDYVGKGCEAYMQISYNKGSLRIGKHHLVHKNHLPRTLDDGTPLRQFRSFNFTDDMDIVIAREVLRNNPFELANGEKRWIQSVEVLKGEDKRMMSLTPRLIKKRIRFLIDKFVAISHGRMPSEEDEMGNILFELERTKRDKIDNPPGRGRKRKKPSSGSGVKFSLAKPEPIDEDNGDIDDDDMSAMEEEPTGPQLRNKKKYGSPSVSAPQKSAPYGELHAFLSYLRRKDEEDRKLREQELELAKEDLAFRKREMDLQRQRFEFEKYERKAHLDLLKTQLQVLERTTGKQQEATFAVKDREQPVEYTIVLDNNHQAVVS